MHNGRILALSATAAFLSACSAPATQSLAPAPPSPALRDSGELTTLSAFTARNNVTGETVRIFPTRETLNFYAASRTIGKQSTSNLLYHGGPVQTAPKLYLVLWGNWTSLDPNGVKARLQSFFGVIGGSKWLNSVSQYTQSDGAHVGNSGNIFARTIADTSTPPRRPTQSQLAAEAAKAASQTGDHTANASYVIALPHGVHPSGFGSQYCAWHSSTNTSGGRIAYTNLPYMPDAGASCGANSVNANGTLDGVTIVSGHEQGETETDPQPNSGWLDSSGAENGDKCAWIDLIDNPNAGGYPTQPLWSNANNGCVQSY